MKSQKSYLDKTKNNVKIFFKDVSKSDCRFLYELLRQRDPSENISHKKMPKYSEHVKFVLSKPYSKWCIIMARNKKLGSIYITKQNEIGIFIDKKLRHKGIGNKALDLFLKENPRKRYLANINPKNTKSIKFFKKNGFKLIQYTYEMIPKEMKE